MSRNLEKWRKRNHICIIHLSFQISTMSLDNFSGPNGRVQVEKQGGGWKEGKKEERLQSMSVQRQSVYVIRVQTESGCQKWSRAHRLTAPPLSAPSLSAPLPSPSTSLPPLQPPRGGCDAMAARVAVPTQHIRCAITLRKEQSICYDKASSAKI